MSKIYLEIVNSSKMTRTKFNVFKTWFWNLILPPHVRLYLPKEDKIEVEKFTALNINVQETQVGKNIEHKDTGERCLVYHSNGVQCIKCQCGKWHPPQEFEALQKELGDIK